jgi:hypothetical protein
VDRAPSVRGLVGPRRQLFATATEARPATVFAPAPTPRGRCRHRGRSPRLPRAMSQLDPPLLCPCTAATTSRLNVVDDEQEVTPPAPLGQTAEPGQSVHASGRDDAADRGRNPDVQETHRVHLEFPRLTGHIHYAVAANCS